MRFSLVIAIVFVFSLPYVNSIPCTEGACCEDGNILPNGTVCRQALDVCDVTEYCTGTSSDCPTNKFAENYETFCGTRPDLGVCENGTCMTQEVIENYELCQEKCSAERGKCTLRGLCVCNDGWQSPPTCDKKSSEENGEKGMEPQMTESKLEEQDKQVLARNRREVKSNEFPKRIGYIASEITDVEKQIMLPMEGPPQKDFFTRFREHPLFIPLIIMLVAVIILVAFTISASILYHSQLKAQMIRKRIKVEKTSPDVPKNVSKIDDPTINIDVGR